MKSKRFGTLSILAACLLFIATFSVIKLQTVKSKDSSTQKSQWEYCAITEATVLTHGERYLGTAWIRTFHSQGSRLRAINYSFNSAKDYSQDEEYIRKWKSEIQQREGIPQTIDAPKQLSSRESIELVKREAIAKAIAHLGEEGWEIAEKGSDVSGKDMEAILYFKRAK
jgi:hypothetical protein